MTQNGNGNGSNGNGLNSHEPSEGNGHGGWRPGAGRKTKKLERDYFRAAKRAVTDRQFTAMCKKAYATTMDDTAHPLAVSKAREFILKALLVESKVAIQLEASVDTTVTRRRVVLDAAAQDDEARSLAERLSARLYGPNGTARNGG